MSGWRRRPGTGISSTWSGCSCSSASTGGVRPAPSAPSDRHPSSSLVPRGRATAPLLLLAGAMTSIPRGRLRPLLGLTVCTALAILVLLGLGTWQLERRAWKLDLIAARAAGLAAPPIPLPDQIADPAALEYRRVWVEGRFRNDRELDLIGRF